MAGSILDEIEAQHGRPRGVGALDQIENRDAVLRANMPTVAGGIARSALQGVTLGFGDELLAGIQTGAGFLGDYTDAVERHRLANAAFSAAYPTTAMASEMAGALPTMLLPGGQMGAAGRVAAGRAVATPGQYIAANARTGAGYGAISGVGNADPGQNSGLVSSIVQRVTGGAVGGTVGGLAGTGIGIAGNVLNNASSRLLPHLRDGSNAAQMLATDAAGNAVPAAVQASRTQALRDIALELRRDAVDPAGLVSNMLPTYRNGRVGTLTQQQVEDVISAHLSGQPAAAIATQIGASPNAVSRMINRFETEVRPRYDGQNILEIMRTPARPNEVVAIPNTTSLAYQATRSEGRGQQVAQQRMLQRQADEADHMAGLIEGSFGSGGFDQFAQQYREMLTGRTRQMYATMYANNAGPVINVAQVPALRSIAGDQGFRRALEFAARDATIQGDQALAAAIMAGQLDARAVDMVQRSLRRAATSIADPSEAHIAHTLRGRFLGVADNAMPEFWGNRGVFRMGMLADEALDLGRTLSLRRGGTNNEAWQFFQTHNGRLNAIDRGIRATQRQIAGAAPGSNAVAALNRQLQMAQGERALVADIVDNFRRSYGAGLLDALNQSGNANRFLTGAEARVFQARVRAILGTNAQPFLDAIAAAQRQKLTMKQLYGNSETAPRLMKMLAQNPLVDTAAGIATMNPARAIRGATEAVAGRVREVRYERIADMLSETEMRTVYELTRSLRDLMQRAQPPAPQRLNQIVMSAVDRLPAPVATRIRETLGNEFRLADVMTFLSGVLGAYIPASMYRTQRQ